MNKFKVNLNAVSQIRNFVQAALNTSCDIDVVSNRFIIDAKSIMGLFALDLSNDVEVVMHTENEELISAFREKIKECIVA